VKQNAVFDFLKEIGVGFRTAKSYPPGHPVMDKVISGVNEQLSYIYSEVIEFSMFFLEQTVIFQDMKIDASKNPAIMALLESLRKIEVDSLTFKPGVTEDDIRNLFEVMATPKMKVMQYGDAATMLTTKGTNRISINAVKFGVQTDGTVQVAGADKKTVKTKEEILSALKNLKNFVEKGLPASDTKTRFADAVEEVENSPVESRAAYGRAIAEIINAVPPQQRLALFQNLEMKPFMLQLLSGARENFLMSLMLNWAEQGDDMNIRKMLGTIDEDKLSRIVPTLKEKMPNIYEQLAHAGVRILLSDKLSSLVTDEDLSVSIKPYFTMLDSSNAPMREEALKSLIMLAHRFVSQGNQETAANIIHRISIALDQEPVVEIVERLIDDLSALYKISRENRQKGHCTRLVEPFNTILSREGLSTGFKKKIIEFLGDTGHPVALSILFSLIWESGIYPEVRSAIVKFGPAAVSQAMVTLRDVEDYNIRMRLVDIMKNIGDKSITVLIKNLSAPEWFLRRNILTILSDIGTPDVVHHLEPLVNDADHRVRLELAKTFSKMEYTDGLLKLLHDEMVEVTAEALKGLKTKLSSEHFVELLPHFRDTGDAVYLEVLKIIDEKKLFEAVNWIAELIESLEMRNDSIAQDIKDLSITTLARLQVDNAHAALVACAQSKDKYVAKRAARVLERLP
jgi:HEAT repeat protein